MVSAATRPSSGDVDDVRPIDGEVSSGGNPLSLLTNLINESRGDLLWLRPDAWRMPRESAMVQVISQAVASGRRSRAIYPVVAMREAPDVLTARAQAGEQIRMLSELPTRLMVIGTTHAVVPEPLGFADEPRLLVRQHALVEALILLFEQLWERAAPVPSLDRGEARPDLRRLPAPAARGRPEGRADRPRPRHEPAHGPPPRRRPDDRAGQRLPVRRRGRGRAARLDLTSGTELRR